MSYRALRGPLLVILLAGCAGSDNRPITPVRDEGQNCAQQFAAFSELLRTGNAEPAYPHSVAGFPALGTDRLHARLASADLSTQQRRDLLARLLTLGRQRHEIALIALAGDTSPVPGMRRDEALQMLDDCAVESLEALHRDPERWAVLTEALQVADDYLGWRRFVGIYPLSSLPVRVAVRQLQSDLLDGFHTPLHELPVRGQLRRYGPDLSASASLTVAENEPPPADSLGLRLPSERTLQGLFAAHAPVLEIDTVGKFDRPGRPGFDRLSARPGVDTDSAEAYRYASLTRFDGDLLLQLNYVWWFDERPANGALDGLAGALDGLVWRVTLDRDGAILLYDSIHPCGCYQQYFPSPRLLLRPSATAWAEPPLLPQPAPALGPGERVVIRLSSGDHYIQRVFGETSVSGTDRASYQLRAYRDLYRVDHPEGPRSLFNAAGLVSGSERGERFYLWPMGVRSPGAMRERGTQATAFLGRRHFDDADLLDAVFRRVNQAVRVTSEEIP